MEIRTATATGDDLLRIMELGTEFGHQMLYQKDSEIVEKYLPRILVAEETNTEEEDAVGLESEKSIVGFYHYIVSGDLGFSEMLRCYRQFPEKVITEATYYQKSGRLCICMQGASHREVFTEFIKYLQEQYAEIWCYCSIKSRRVDTYEALGFSFNLEEQFTFFNCNKGGYSTYRLGRWTKLS